MRKKVTTGTWAIGRRETLAYGGGKRLTFKKAVLAKCYECTGRYLDGKFDCRISDCPLHPFMPYRGRAMEDGSPTEHGSAEQIDLGSL